MPGGHEPDDGVAMVQAFHSPELRVAGVSVVFGNAPVDRGYAIAREIVARFAPGEIGVHQGSARASPDPTPASRALIAALEQEPLTVLALGPATNVAAALRERPDLAGRIETVVLVIGRRPDEALTFPGGGPNLLDFNFELDPEAAEVVVGSGAPVVLAPFELAAKLPIDAQEWASVWDTPFGEFFRRPIEDYLDWFGDNYGRRATYPFDSFRGVLPGGPRTPPLRRNLGRRPGGPGRWVCGYRRNQTVARPDRFGVRGMARDLVPHPRSRVEGGTSPATRGRLTRRSSPSYGNLPRSAGSACSSVD